MQSPPFVNLVNIRYFICARHFKICEREKLRRKSGNWKKEKGPNLTSRGSSQVTASPPNQDNVTLAPIFVLDGNLIPGSWCECRQTTSNEDCMCHGAGLLEIPSNLSTTLKTL
ncbi:hypothetical protein M8J75_005071 [Diaphorina citri]|nr:hypothetical protein M8J75_005071 [Diaphorina citri]